LYTLLLVALDTVPAASANRKKEDLKKLDGCFGGWTGKEEEKQSLRSE
jgi:hypothetical protein